MIIFNKNYNLSLLYMSKVTVSKSEARRSIKNNGIKINEKQVVDEKRKINLDDFKNENRIKISYGKKKHYIIKLI